jgi:histidinol-phosphate aminotransferase
VNARDWVRPEILELETYDPLRGTGVALDNNENPWPPPGLVDGINRYPEQPPRELLRRMAGYYAVGDDSVLPTRGSDDAIDALVRCGCRPGRDAVLVMPPTFGMYAVSAAIQGAAVVEVPLGEGFDLPYDDLLRAREGVKIVFLCSPNNPTGQAIPNERVAAICAAWAGWALVVVDEAYAEFMRQPSATSLLPRFGNLAVLRTLSKGLALAGARVGALLASREIVSLVRKVLPPYLLPSPSVAAAQAALSGSALDIAQARIARIVRERDAVASALAGHPGVRRVFPSDANFVFAEFTDANAVHARLQAAGIRVRAFGSARIANCLRISIGSPAENRALLDALETADA